MFEGLIDKAENHLKQNNMGYFQHMRFASTQGCRCLRAATYLFVHSVFPCFFPSAGSNLVAQLNSVFTDWKKQYGCRGTSDEVVG